MTGERASVEKSNSGEGRILYDCTPWSGESRRLFGSLLETGQFQHVWQGTTVSVREEDEDEVDLLVDDVLATATPALDPTAQRLTYEVVDWSPSLQTEFTDQLTISEVPYEWDPDGNVIVMAQDEELVDAVLEMLPDDDGGERLSSEDGVAVHELLDDLFMRSDRLSSRPNDAAATLAFVEGAQTLVRLTTPFGFSHGDWLSLVGSVRALSDAIDPDEGDGSSDDDVSRLASESRDVIRRYI